MKKLTKVLWGIVLVIAGVLFALNALGVTNYDVFFDGWWTLFIIIPCLVGVITDRDKTGSLIGLAIGVLLLLWQQNILELDFVWKLFLPALVIILGLKLIFGNSFKKKDREKIEELKKMSGDLKSNFTIFSGSNLSYNGEFFDGAEYTAIFGGIDVDLRGALIEKDCVINASAIFGGIDIKVPEGVNIKLSSTSVFGGADNKVKRDNIDGAPTIYINTTNIFGGTDVK